MKIYKVKRIEENALSDQSILQETAWKEAIALKDFQYPWEADETSDMEFKALWDHNHLFFQFSVICESPLCYVDKNHKMEVVDSDRVEIFFRKDEKLNPYYCLEMDALGRVMDYKTNYYRKFSYDWSWPGMNQLKVFVKRENTSYTLAGRISLESLANLGLLIDGKLEAGLFRGQCLNLPTDDKEAELKWISWIKPIAETPDFHIPSSFGILELQDI